MFFFWIFQIVIFGSQICILEFVNTFWPALDGRSMDRRRINVEYTKRRSFGERSARSQSRDREIRERRRRDGDRRGRSHDRRSRSPARGRSYDRYARQSDYFVAI